MNKKRAVLLVNLGTPEQATTSSVKQFLRSFLSDKRVVDLPRLLWLPLLNVVILPFRIKKVTRLYQKIWLPTGSPLRVISERLFKKTASALKTHDIACDYAMTYGEPSIAASIKKFTEKGVDELLVIPLYPQYSVSTTAPVFDQVADALKRQINVPSLIFKHDYHDHPLYIKALVESIKRQWQTTRQPEKLIFSFHGIPKRYVTNGDPYQEQCEKTVKLVVEQLALTPSEYVLAYQSRFGKDEWLMPYVDKELAALAQAGCQSVDVICPAFATECLETLEEMADENKLLFLQHGGQQYHLIPCLNDDNAHAALFTSLALNQ